MQQYGEVFARVYDKRWGVFAETVAPKIISFLDTLPGKKSEMRVLDLCCGTGQLASRLLQNGYNVVGLDQSSAMLKHAREKTQKYIDRKQAVFVQGNAENFSFDSSFTCVLSTFDALNHLPDTDALRRCFESVRKTLAPGGLFLFDLNTRTGLTRWAGMMIHDDEDITFFNRGIFTKEMDRAFNQITGFVRNDFGMYDKFNESFYNTIFEIDEVESMLGNCGFTDVYGADINDLSETLADPERAPRVFFVAKTSK